MLPAPAQGAILIVCREKDTRLLDICSFLHDVDTAACVNVERTFLSALMGGCSTPVGALAFTEGKFLHFQGNVCSLDGKICLTVEKRILLKDAAFMAVDAANELLSQGAAALIQKTQTTAS